LEHPILVTTNIIMCICVLSQYSIVHCIEITQLNIEPRVW